MSTGQSAPAASPEPAAIDVRSVSFRYPSGVVQRPGVEAVDSITMRVDPGTRLGVLGPNGGGKSTLIKLIMGILEPDDGRIEVFGMSPSKARRAGLIGCLPQRIELDRAWPLSVRQVVALPIACRRRPWQRLTGEQQHAVDEALEMVGLAEMGERPIGSLSGGQLQRAMIARAIAGRPKLLILDEPTVGVDVAGQHRFAELITTLHERLGLTTVIVTHDLRAIAAVADRIACLARSLHFHDARAGLTPQVLADVFAHDVAAVLGEVHVNAHLAEDCPDPGTHTPCCGHEHPQGDAQ